MDLYANGLPPGFFTHFGRPMVKNYESVFLTMVRPVDVFDRCATKTWVFGPVTMSQTFKILTWRDFGPLYQWSRKFPSKIFYPFRAPYGRKLVKFGNLTHLVAPQNHRSQVLVAPQNHRSQVLVARYSKALFGRTPVKRPIRNFRP